MIIFIGDVHGEFKELSNKLANTNVKNSTFIQVGDFGLGFKRKENEAAELNTLNKRLKDLNNEMYVIRGNHDDPSYFTSNRSYSNILFLEDYTLLKVEGKNILLVGGAISIDRSWRVLNNSYWLEEVFVYDKIKLENALRNFDRVDIVVTHNAPNENEKKASQINFKTNMPNITRAIKFHLTKASLKVLFDTSKNVLDDDPICQERTRNDRR